MTPATITEGTTKNVMYHSTTSSPTRSRKPNTSSTVTITNTGKAKQPNTRSAVPLRTTNTKEISPTNYRAVQSTTVRHAETSSSIDAAKRGKQIQIIMCD